MPVFIDGNIRLPDSARLKMQRTEGIHAPHSIVPFHNSSHTGGAIFLVQLMANSRLNHFLEGEVAVLVDAQSESESGDQTKSMLLSSGTEDYVSAVLICAGLVARMQMEMHKCE